MSTGELWTLHEQVTSILAEAIQTKKEELEERLRKIATAGVAINPRRPYPKVLQKYQNPTNPAETWSGRGKQPHWVQAQLRAGKELQHLLIDGPPTKRRRRNKRLKR